MRTELTCAVVAIAALGLFTSCSNTPPPLPEYKAVRIQNEETKKRIDTFSEHNERTIKKTKEASDAQKKESEAITKSKTALETARDRLKELLNED